MTLTGWSGYCCACAVTDASGNVRAKNANNRSIYVSSEPADDHLSKENITSASAESGTVRRARAFYLFTLHLLAGAASGRASRAEQTSQIFSILGSLKFIRHVRCYSNSGQNVAVPRLSALCQ
jgi:hypothetical protein